MLATPLLRHAPIHRTRSALSLSHLLPSPKHTTLTQTTKTTKNTNKSQQYRLTLLLAPPGSGKSTFLKALSRDLVGVGSLKVSGDVRYNGVDAEDKRYVLKRSVAYVTQHDHHLPQLTVEQVGLLVFCCCFVARVEVSKCRSLLLVSTHSLTYKTKQNKKTKKN